MKSSTKFSGGASSDFFFTDDNFGLNFRTHPDYMVQLFDALKKLDLNGWTAQAEMMVGNFPELLGLARQAHLDKFFIGFESINASNRRDLGGKSKGGIEEYRRVIDVVHQNGIGVVGLFVLGLDGDTPDVFENTWDFVRSSELDAVSFTIMTPYPGTELRREYVEQGRLLPGAWLGQVRHRARCVSTQANDCRTIAARLRLDLRQSVRAALDCRARRARFAPTSDS